MNYSKWNVINIECSDFKGFDIEDLTAQFRCDQPASVGWGSTPETELDS